MLIVGMGATASAGLGVALAVPPAPPPPAPPCAGPVPGFRPSALCPPANWTGHRFALAQAYPATAPVGTKPWLAFDPTTQPDKYVKAILAYFYQGNIRTNVNASFDPTLNTTRQWYNAPWQDVGTNGREPIHGLTRERVSRAGELAPQQTSQWNNYAVGFYNAPGGMTIGKLWADHAHPNIPAAASFPEGTVAAKLLFTTASVAEVPYLAGSPEWDAYVYANPNDPNPTPTSPRAAMKVRLLQIDVAVRIRASPPRPAGCSARSSMAAVRAAPGIPTRRAGRTWRPSA